MREVAVLGIGQTKIDEHWDKSLRELAGEAILAAMLDAGITRADALYIGNMMSGSANHQQHLGTYMADWVGIKGAEALHVEDACSSGAAAFRSAVMAVASGAVDVAIAAGVEKMTDSPGNEITAELATAADQDWEASQGLSFVALNALIMRRYMYEYKWERDHFAGFSINAHANGVHNPFARFQEAISEAQYRKAPMIAEPINLLDASPMGDGAAAAVLVPAEMLRRGNGRKIIRVVGSGAATDTIAIHHRRDPLWLSAAEKSVKQAYSQAKIGPEDIDLFEAHDAFTIMAALSLEACGFAERGQGPRLAMEGEIRPNGKIPIATRGGLKARGHPVGATGMYQIVEVVQQLRGEAGATQVDGARYGMAQNIGGSGSNIITHILMRE
ncbi:thiolase domain-containing protein [Anaerolinea thermophila]|uniref:Thiolase family protein n=1 Tax=Anaerolinea thermophila (strain DSM 14523 / JCM 11388 / NBRC 100420 / UNI-1) TaxID=926569 RepID=E8N5P3_ANATU|nr:thiolase domain-containing protein [Anaerolinea thermophila]BAJ63757.1 thiolase family protein [Anaerolinea thermophila UNI-1]